MQFRNSRFIHGVQLVSTVPVLAEYSIAIRHSSVHQAAQVCIPVRYVLVLYLLAERSSKLYYTYKS
jgi:hypothetical protein